MQIFFTLSLIVKKAQCCQKAVPFVLQHFNTLFQLLVGWFRGHGQVVNPQPQLLHLGGHIVYFYSARANLR